VYPTAKPPVENARRQLLERADLIMAISDYTLDLAARYVTDRSKLRFVPVGIREDLFQRVNRQSPAEARRAHGLPADRLLILMACNLIPRKGVVEVVQAFAQAHARVPEAFLVIVGKGPERARLEALIAEHGLAEHVRITPYLGDDFAMAQHYRASDLYIMFSKTIVDRRGVALEGFGISYIDASAVGIPVIGGRSGGVPSAVVDGVTGFLVDPEGPEPVHELAARMTELLRDEALRRRMGCAGQERVFASLTWDATARQTRECYDATLARRGAG
jgi:phosphatidylinositol alpha-1,6-mannosyltransferase